MCEALSRQVNTCVAGVEVQGRLILLIVPAGVLEGVISMRAAHKGPVEDMGVAGGGLIGAGPVTVGRSFGAGGGPVVGVGGRVGAHADHVTPAAIPHNVPQLFLGPAAQPGSCWAICQRHLLCVDVCKEACTAHPHSLFISLGFLSDSGICGLRVDWKPTLTYAA